MTAIEEMSQKRLRAELVFAERQLHTHRLGVHGYCQQAWCGPYPCEVAREASRRLREVSEAIVERRDRIEKANAEWGR